jgi:hypothetical protein
VGTQPTVAYAPKRHPLSRANCIPVFRAAKLPKCNVRRDRSCRVWYPERPRRDSLRRWEGAFNYRVAVIPVLAGIALRHSRVLACRR